MARPPMFSSVQDIEIILLCNREFRTSAFIAKLREFKNLAPQRSFPPCRGIAAVPGMDGRFAVINIVL